MERPKGKIHGIFQIFNEASGLSDYLQHSVWFCINSPDKHPNPGKQCELQCCPFRISIHSCFKLLESLLTWQLAFSLTWTDEKIIMSGKRMAPFFLLQAWEAPFFLGSPPHCPNPNKDIQWYFLQNVLGFPGEFQVGLIPCLVIFQRRAYSIVPCPMDSNLGMKSSVLARMGTGKIPWSQARASGSPPPLTSGPWQDSGHLRVIVSSAGGGSRWTIC